MESQPQNPEFRINPENFHPWVIYLVPPVWRDPLTVFSWTVHSIFPSVQVSLVLVCLYQLVEHPSFDQTP